MYHYVDLAFWMSFLSELKEPTPWKSTKESNVFVHKLLMQLNKVSPAKVFVIQGLGEHVSDYRVFISCRKYPLTTDSTWPISDNYLSVENGNFFPMEN